MEGLLFTDAQNGVTHGSSCGDRHIQFLRVDGDFITTCLRYCPEQQQRPAVESRFFGQSWYPLVSFLLSWDPFPFLWKLDLCNFEGPAVRKGPG